MVGILMVLSLRGTTLVIVRRADGTMTAITKAMIAESGVKTGFTSTAAPSGSAGSSIRWLETTVAASVSTRVSSTDASTPLDGSVVATSAMIEPSGDFTGAAASCVARGLTVIVVPALIAAGRADCREGPGDAAGPGIPYRKKWDDVSLLVTAARAVEEMSGTAINAAAAPRPPAMRPRLLIPDLGKGEPAPPDWRERLIEVILR
jgi:hypothetical protein